MIPGAGDGDGALDSPPPRRPARTCSRSLCFPRHALLWRGNEPRKPRSISRRSPRSWPPRPWATANVHCAANVIASDSRLSRPTLDVAQGFVSQHWLAHASLRRRQQTPRPVIVIPLDPYHVPSPPPPTGSSRTEAQRWPACATRATTSMTLPMGQQIRTCLPGYLLLHSRYQVAAMVHRSPITTSTLARPVRTSRPWIPRHYPATSSAAGGPALPVYSPICLSPFSCGQHLLRPFQRAGAVSYHLHPPPAGSRISRARRLTHTLAFAICHLRTVTCGRPCVLIFPQLRRWAIP